MSDEKPVMEMTRAEFARAKRGMLTQTIIEEKQEAGERFMKKLEERHANPPQPVKVKPLQERNNAAPIGNGLVRLF